MSVNSLELQTWTSQDIIDCFSGTEENIANVATLLIARRLNLARELEAYAESEMPVRASNGYHEMTDDEFIALARSEKRATSLELFIDQSTSPTMEQFVSAYAEAEAKNIVWNLAEHTFSPDASRRRPPIAYLPVIDRVSCAVASQALFRTGFLDGERPRHCQDAAYGQLSGLWLGQTVLTRTFGSKYIQASPNMMSTMDLGSINLLVLDSPGPK